MPQESPDRKEGASHTTGAGETPAQPIVRSGRADVPADTHPVAKAEGGATHEPAIVGTRDTGEPDETPGE